MARFEIGDRVRVVDPGEGYTTYADFFDYNGIPVVAAARYSYSRSVDQYEDWRNTEYIVQYIGKHENCNDTLYVIGVDTDWSPLYLIGEGGLKEVRRKYIVPVRFYVEADIEVEEGNITDAIIRALQSPLPAAEEALSVITQTRRETAEEIQEYSDAACRRKYGVV
jgi:hypothetical protein